MSEPDIWKIIEGDAFYRQFIDKDANFDVKSEAASQGLAVAEQLKKLTEGIALLDRELQSQVLANHDNLLTQATWIEQLESVLATMQSHVQCLLTAVERLRGKIVEPFERIETQTLMLARLQATSDLLRRVARTQLIVKKLNALMSLGSAADINKAAQCVAELDRLCEDVDLSGLEVLEGDLRSVRMHRAELESRSKLLATQALAGNNLPQAVSAMRVFRDLGVLPQATTQTTDSALTALKTALTEALDWRTLTAPASTEAINRQTRGGPGRASLPAPGNASLFRSRLWSALEQALHTSTLANARQMQTLRLALEQADHDDPGHKEAQDRQLLVQRYWGNVNRLLADCLQQAAQESSFVKQALEGEYPKLLHLYLDLCKRLDAFEGHGAKQTFVVDRKVVESFENAYLSRSVSRLLDPVHQMFSADQVPSSEELDALVRTISSELSVSLVDEALSLTVAKNVSKTLRLFCLKCEQLTATSQEATQVIDSCTPAQLTNIGLANALHYLLTQVTRVLGNMSSGLSAPAVAVVTEAVANETVTRSIVDPWLASVADAAEAVIATMHAEDFVSEQTSSRKDFASDRAGGGSAYVKELKEFVARVDAEYLTPFSNQQVVRKSSLLVAGRCLELFVRHVCLVRPVEEPGRRKLQQDFTQLESALSPLVGAGSLSDVGPPHRALRSLRAVVMATPQTLAECGALGAALPFSAALLFLFSHAPPEMASPHTAANWSVSRLSQWLDDHPRERDRLELVSGALQKYQQAVKQKGDAAFHPVYPVMVDLLRRGTEFDRQKL